MSTPMIMDIEEAYIYVKHYGELEGARSIFHTIELMESNWDDLDNVDRAAYKLIKREMAHWAV